MAFWAIGRAEHVPILTTGGGVIAAAGAGFAPFNYPRAKVFLGDVGSYFLGAWMAMLVILGLRAAVAPEAILGPVALYLTDTGTTLVRRFRGGEAWYLPHRSHTYQRLTGLGWSHTRTTAVVAVAIACCSVLGAVALTGSLLSRAVAAPL